MGLCGSDEQTVAVINSFKCRCQRAQVKDKNTYLVDHATRLYAFDPQGSMCLTICREAGPEAIAAGGGDGTRWVIAAFG